MTHTTLRVHDLAFRAGTALFGHFGIEWDLREATPQQRAELAEWVALHKSLRPLLASGIRVRSDHPAPATWLHGVVSPDSRHAVYAAVAVATPVTWPPGQVTLSGLDDDTTHAVRPLPPGDILRGPELPAPVVGGLGDAPGTGARHRRSPAPCPAPRAAGADRATAV